MPGYGDVVDGFNGTFDHHLPSATSADKYSNDPVVFEIYIMGANVVVTVAPHELVAMRIASYADGGICE